MPDANWHVSQVQRTLTVNIIGNGTVTKDPDQPTYNDGQVVQLTANPGLGWAWAGWTGAVNAYARQVNVTMDQDKTVTASFENVVALLIYPNCGETIYVGFEHPILWSKANYNVGSIDIYVTRDNGVSYTPVALNIPNTGSGDPAWGRYDWTVPPPGTNTDGNPVFSAKIRILTYDDRGHLVFIDESDCPFSIYDATTAAVVTKLETFPIDGGVQLNWVLNVRGIFESIQLERSDNETGPWLTVAADVTQDGDQMVAVDRTAAAGQRYWYRLMGTTAQGQQASLGSVQGTAGAPREFALRAAWPNPTSGALTTEFAIARTAKVTLAVFDLHGRVVTTLANGVYAPGRYQVKWDGRTDHGAVPAGLYFLHMTTLGNTFTSRVVVAE
jgi:hypothetical protein